MSDSFWNSGSRFVLAMWTASIVSTGGCYTSNARVAITPSSSPNIVNGHCVEEVRIAKDPRHQLELPDNAVVIREENSEEIRISVRKVQNLYGHPPDLVSIEDAEKTMGLVAKGDGESISIATYGEYLLPGAGTRSIELKVFVPATTKVVLSKGLSGEGSVANGIGSCDIAAQKDGCNYLDATGRWVNLVGVQN